jgi:hypothetical protein
MKLSFQQAANSALAYTHQLITAYGPRLAGTKNCLQAASHLRDRLANVCGKADLEHFTTRPGVFNGFFLIEPTLYILFSLVALLGHIQIAALGILLTIVYGFLQFGYYKEYFGFLFPKRTCANVIASLEPIKRVEQQILLSGHHDSAYEMRMLRSHQRFYGLKIILPDIAIMTGLVAALLWLGIEWTTGKTPEIAIGLQLFWLLSIPVAGTKFFMVGTKGTPGAGDNLISSAMLVEFAKFFAADSGISSLQHTRLKFVSFDAEEAGLRGARSFAENHLRELTCLPTYLLNMDSIYKVSELKFLISDLNHTVKLDKTLASLCLQTAHQAGYPAQLSTMKFGGGSTDAAELAKIGVHCTTLLAMPTDLIRSGMVYHTMQDLPEAIEPLAVQACLEVLHNVVIHLDQNISYDSLG